MNKVSKFFAAFAAVALVSACSSDEPANAGGENGGVQDGQKAYLAITINSTGDLGRSTDFETPSYVDGDENEHKVDNARFFFFDGAGNYVLQASIANPSFGDDNNETNIEYLSTKNILVLEDLKGNEYPTYMLTVLNMADFTAETTLDATTKKLSAYADNYAVDKTGKLTKANFVMSTSAYFGADANHSDKYYNVTMLNSNNFKLTPEEAVNTSPVDVYVERLAAKVQLTVKAPTKTINGVEYFVLNQTVAGDLNDQENSESKSNSEVYLEVVGWGLNATATQSYVGKQLLPEWAQTTAEPFTNWQNAGLYRSFWAYSQPWVEGAVEPNLKYTNTKELLGEASLDYAEYCYENTNLATTIFKKNNQGQNLVIPSKVTHVVLYTRIINAKGEVQNVVEFQGTPFLEETFKAYILNSFKNASAGLNYYYLTGTSAEGDATTNTYAQVSVDDIVFEGIKGQIGMVDIKLADPEKDLYKKIEEDGVEKYVKLEGAENDLQDRLTAFQGQTPLYWHNKGANLYYIPIEHNATDNTKEKDGYYGVVRNHWYKLTVNNFSKIGHAVYDPEGGSETLKPEEPEDPLFYVGARINVLSWRIINQSVEL